MFNLSEKYTRWKLYSLEFDLLSSTHLKIWKTATGTRALLAVLVSNDTTTNYQITHVSKFWKVAGMVELVDTGSDQLVRQVLQHSRRARIHKQELIVHRQPEVRSDDWKPITMIGQLPW